MKSFLEYLVENYVERLSQAGVSQDIIDYVQTLDNRDRGRAIASLLANPNQSIDDIKPGEKFRVDDEKTHQWILDADPSADKVYYRVIAQWLAGKSIRLPEDTGRLREVLKDYNLHKSKYQTAYVSKYEKFTDLEREYKELTEKQKYKWLGDGDLPRGAYLIGQNHDWYYYQAHDREAMLPW